MLKHVSEVMGEVIDDAQEQVFKSGENEANFYLVSALGAVVTLPARVLVSLSGSDEVADIYEYVTTFITEYNKEKMGESLPDMRIAGVIHTFQASLLDGKISDENARISDDSSLLVVALDENKNIEMAVMPLDDDGKPGEPIYGSGGSPHFDPWGAFTTGLPS